MNKNFHYINYYITNNLFPCITTSEVLEFNLNTKQNINLESYYVHVAECKVNLCSSNPKLREFSILNIAAEANTLIELGFKNITIHPGSTKNLISTKEGINHLIDSLIILIKDTKGKIEFIVENMTGGSKLLQTNEEILYFIKLCKERKIWKWIKLCWDTCHFFASNYNLNDTENINWPFCDYIDDVKVIHLNNSKFNLGKKVDNHSYWCSCNTGYINLTTGQKLYEKFKNQISMVLETTEKYIDYETQFSYIKNQNNICLCGSTI